MSFDKFVKNLNRTSTLVQQKVGWVDKTVDKEFDEEERRFKSLSLKTEGLYKEAKNYLDAVRALSMAQLRISEHITQFYDETAILGLCGLKYKDCMEYLDSNARQELDVEYRATVLEPIGRFVSLFPDINEAIKRRGNKLLDYDALRAKVKKLAERPSDDASKMPRAEAQMNAAKESYDEGNNQLKDEIPRLIEARIPYFDPSLEALIRSQTKFYNQSYEQLTPLQKYFEQSTAGEYENRIQDALHKMRELSIVYQKKP